jgi:hypothetical protein
MKRIGNPAITALVAVEQPFPLTLQRVIVTVIMPILLVLLSLPVLPDLPVRRGHKELQAAMGPLVLKV